MDIYIADTSAFIRDKYLWEKLPPGELVIHTVVIEELDSLKARGGYRGVAARTIINRLYELKGRGDFAKGIPCGSVRVRIDDRKPAPDVNLRFGFDPAKPDNLLLCVAKQIAANAEGKVMVLTADKFLAVKASLEGLGTRLVKSPPAKKRLVGNKGYLNRAVEMVRARA